MALVALALFSATLGCTQRGDGWRETPLPDNAVVILQHGDAQKDESRRAEELILRAAFPNATHLPADQLIAAGPVLRRDGAVLLVPRIRELSPTLRSALTNHISRGGPTLVWGLDPLSRDQADQPSILPAATEFYSFTTRRIEGVHNGLLNVRSPMRLQSPFPFTGTTNATVHWIPLARALAPANLLQGWPASLWVDTTDPKLLRAWGWIGWDPDENAQQPQQALLQLVASRLAQRNFLLRAGFERYSFEPNDTLNIPVKIAVAPPSRGPWRVTAEMESEDGAVTRRLSDTIAPPHPVSIISTSLFLGTAPRRLQQEQRTTLHVSLLNATNNLLYAENRQPVRMRAEADTVRGAPEERIGARAAMFTLGRRNVLLLGADYAPLSAASPHSGLDPDFFDPALLKRDISLFRDAGFNAIAVRYTAEEQAPQLRILLDDLRDNRIWALLQIPALSPWNPDWAEAKNLLDGLGLSTNHHVFAISPGIIAPPRPGAEMERLDSAWKAWLEEQYGSVARAEEKLGIHNNTPAIGSWWDAENSASPAWRPAARRFLEDFAARHYSNCRAFLRARNWNGLFSAASGTPLDPAAGAALLDFITLDGAALDASDRDRAAFYTAYARTVSDNKPTLWINLSAAMPYPPSNNDLRKQASALDNTFREMTRAYASGAIIGGFTGGPLGSDGNDRGLVNPDGSWRPAGDAVRSRMQDWRRAPNQPPPWRGMEIDTVNMPKSPTALWREIKGEPDSEHLGTLVEEMRPIGWNRYAAETPLTGLSGAEPDAPEPLQFFNATWGSDNSPAPSRIARARMRQAKQLELLNTGLARWQAFREGETGSIWITARRGNGRPTRIPVSDTMPGARTTITWTPTDKGTWTLRPTIHPGIAFGEALRVEVD